MRRVRWDKAFHAPPQPGFVSVADETHRKATIVIEHLIQASDIAHTMQHWQVYRKWNERLFEEEYNAYLDGFLEEDPAAMWYQGELDFFDFTVIPLAQKLKECGVFGVSGTEYLNYALSNKREWLKGGKFVVERYLDKYGEGDTKMGATAAGSRDHTSAQAMYYENDGDCMGRSDH